MFTRSVRLIVAALATCGCGGSQSATPLPASAERADTSADRPVEVAAEDVSEVGRYRYDDSRLSENERRAVRAAAQSIPRPPRLGPFSESDFRYDVMKTDEGWWVTEWRVHSFDEHGSPNFMPGGFMGVALDNEFAVRDVSPGL